LASDPHDFAAGEVLTAARMDKMPQGIIAHATPITADVGPTSGTNTLDIITAPAVTLLTADRRLRLTLSYRSRIGTVVGDIFSIRFQEGATVLANFRVRIDDTGFGHEGNTYSVPVSSPTAAAHTYKATITRANGTGTGTINATATEPIFFEVEDVGQA
jgi:hypothetical protein